MDKAMEKQKQETVKMKASSGMDVEMPLADFLKFYQEKQGDMVATRQAVLEMAGSKAKADRAIQPFLTQLEEVKAALALLASVDHRALPNALEVVAKRLTNLATNQEFSWLCFIHGATDAARSWIIKTPEKWGQDAQGRW